ncbi:GlcNAc-transferase family protein [Roseiconus lacunae]|uniref:GlcNAc-transferase family protein n=1 Tax=Roseiconus lacunae TaxID=2605694 RepID=UPI001E3DDCFC|nr:GlcNAc-transferase family protein [Roseiconus lacunae]MCD0458684.1 2OG-Fe(II) oxygenase [Roseiconus lacunae]
MQHDSRIFVGIAAYCDSEVVPTVQDLFAKATVPSRVTVGVCWQFRDGKDPRELSFGEHGGQVRVVAHEASESEGVCWARRQAEMLLEEEEYVLQTDAHMRFVAGWDELMLNELAACGKQEKCVLSAGPAGYTLPDQLSPNPRLAIKRLAPFTASGKLLCRPESLGKPPVHPLLVKLIAAEYVFSPASRVHQVPTDPSLYHEQEELAMSARLFTHGWDVYCPTQVLLYHNYYSQHPKDVRPRLLHWQENKQWREYSTRACERMEALFNGNSAERLGEFGCGTERPLAHFVNELGIDFAGRAVSDRGLLLQFVPGIENYRRRPIRISEHRSEKPRYIPVDASKNGATSETTDVDRPIPLPAVLAGHTDTVPAETDLAWRQPTSLKKGDFVPFLWLKDQDRNDRGMHLYAGRQCAMWFLPKSNGEWLGNFFKEMKGRSKEFHAINAYRVFVIPASCEELSKIQSEHQADFNIWADPDGTFCSLFGCQVEAGDLKQAGYALLNENLRIIEMRHFTQPASSADELLSRMNGIHQAIMPPMTFDQPVAPVLHVPNVLTPQQCDSVIKFFRLNRRIAGKVGAGKSYVSTAKVRTDCIVKNRKMLRALDTQFSRTLYPEVEKVFGFKVTHRELFKIGHYPGDKNGYFKDHRDNFDKPLSYRRCALTLNLNDDYEGGEVQFKEYGNHLYRAPAGSAVVFPCSLMHGVRPITAGDRFMMVTFMYDEPGFELKKQLFAHDVRKNFEDDIVRADVLPQCLDPRLLQESPRE